MDWTSVRVFFLCVCVCVCVCGARSRVCLPSSYECRTLSTCRSACVRACVRACLASEGPKASRRQCGLGSNASPSISLPIRTVRCVSTDVSLTAASYCVAMCTVSSIFFLAQKWMVVCVQTLWPINLILKSNNGIWWLVGSIYGCVWWRSALTLLSVSGLTGSVLNTCMVFVRPYDCHPNDCWPAHRFRLTRGSCAFHLVTCKLEHLHSPMHSGPQKIGRRHRRPFWPNPLQWRY